MRAFPILAALMLASPVTAETATIIAPVFAQLVTAPLPEGFVTAFEDATATGYLNEAVPAGESPDDWTQMITLTGSKGMALGDAPTNAAGFADYLAGSYSQACPDSFALSPLQTKAVPGAQDVFAGYLSCGSLPGKDMSESMVFMVLVGAEDIYSLQWAEHGKASATPIGFPGGEWLNRLAQLQAKARICDVVAGEAAPYPSCFD